MACTESDPPTATDPDRPLVVLIEDEPGLPEMLWMALQARGYVVAHAAGPVGVARAAGAEADLLVLDVSLRTGQGFGVVEHMQSQPTLAGLPLVVYTVRELDDHDRSRLELGPTTYLTKTDSGPEELETAVLDRLQLG